MEIRIVKEDAIPFKKDFREIGGFVHHESFYHVSDIIEIDIDEMIYQWIKGYQFSYSAAYQVKPFSEYLKGELKIV